MGTVGHSGSMKTPNSVQLDLAATWLDACQGEDREELLKVQKWLEEVARKQRVKESLKTDRWEFAQ